MDKHLFYERLDELAPLELQDEWDNSGVQIDCGNDEVKMVLAALEISFDVIDEAVSKGADMILTHHPLFFEPLKSIDSNELSGAYSQRLIRAGISVFSMHTNFDNAPYGMNDMILEELGAEVEGCALDERGEEIPCLKMAVFPEAVSVEGISSRLHEILEYQSPISITGDTSAMADRIALCTGAGGCFWKDALRNGAQLFITGEIKHHEAGPARECGLNVIAAGHWGTEWLFSDFMKLWAEQRCPEIELIPSELRCDPVDATRIFVEKE
ncbi:MAG: Nif3-like dinuclear metal center hexameric protein [Firmicutes bacterium]|nr:Nif3-like dinuclear metal center hexameric protein [Bacillota bacterium]